MNEQTYLVFENNLKIIPILSDFNSFKFNKSNTSSIYSIDPLNIEVDIMDYQILYDEFIKEHGYLNKGINELSIEHLQLINSERKKTIQTLNQDISDLST